ncbi:MAG: ROK family transcriptional regulator, partial [Bacillota bacterium]
MRKSRVSVDASYLRQYNQRLILDAVYERNTTSRAELSKALALSKPAISDNLSELLRLGVIDEVGEGAVAKKGGRKPLLLKFNMNHKYIVAVDLNYTNPIVALGNLKNEILCENDMRIDRNASRDHRFSVIENGIDELLRTSGVEKEALLCIAVSSPGVFDAQGNILSQNEGYGRILWSGSNLRDALQKKYSVDIHVKNDIKVATLGEWACGAGRGEENLLYISCGAGLGAGIVLNAKLYEGRHFNAGEIYYYLDGNKPSHVNGLEDQICMKRLVQTCIEDVRKGMKTCLQDKAKRFGFEDIVVAYQKKDPYVRRQIRRICGELCTLIFNLGNFLALEKVIFGGEYAVFGDTLLNEYEKHYQPRVQLSAGVKLAALGKYSGVHGMLYTARNAYF